MACSGSGALPRLVHLAASFSPNAPWRKPRYEPNGLAASEPRPTSRWRHAASRRTPRRGGAIANPPQASLLSLTPATGKNCALARPAEDGFFMPPEWAPHARCWMQWPCREPLFGEHLRAAREAYAEVAQTIAEFEPVTMIASPEHVVEASLKCGPGVSTFSLPLDDSWCRDSGPTFVVNAAGEVAGIDWKWNAWGNKYPDHQRDAAVARAVLDHLGMRRHAAPLVLEGGAIHVDGEGTLLTTESCLLNPNRNPDLGREEIEELLRQYLGVRKIIWLKGGLEDDDTDGHVDNVACFARPGLVLALSSGDPADGNYAMLNDNLERLRAATDAA